MTRLADSFVRCSRLPLFRPYVVIAAGLWICLRPADLVWRDETLAKEFTHLLKNSYLGVANDVRVRVAEWGAVIEEHSDLTVGARVSDGIVDVQGTCRCQCRHGVPILEV